MGLTESMEDYLRLVYEFGLDGGEVRVSALAGRFGISAPSVTNMAKRLARSDLIRRAPYRGLTLTEDGRKATLGVVRRHRLVEFYLVEVLGYSGDEVHEEVENLEHAVYGRFVDRMEKLLGHPEVDGHGAPIPTKDGEVFERLDVPLAGFGVGQALTLLSFLGTSKLHVN